MKVRLAAAALMFACTAKQPQADILSYYTADSTALANSEAYALRPPLLGHLDYRQAIKYINDGMQYLDPGAGFVVSPIGEMCFFARPISPTTIYEDHYRYWCVYPQSVGSVEALTNGGGSLGEVRLWCKHSYPHCAHRIDYPNPFTASSWTANQITVQIIPRLQERAAIEDLIFVMGGGAAASSTAMDFSTPLSAR